MERPAQRAGARIERKDGAGRIDGVGPVLAGPADEEKSLYTVGGCRMRQRPFGVFNIPLVDIDDAALAEIGAGLARVGIDRMQLRIHRADIDALLARLRRGRGIRLPVGDAAVLEIGLRQRFKHRLGVIGPFHLAGIGLEREDPVEGRAEIDRVVDEKRRRRPHCRRKIGLCTRGRRAIVHPGWRRSAG